MSKALPELWREQDHFRDTIAAKLRGLLDTPQTRNLDRCGREKIFRTCTECGEFKRFEYHCDLKFCPRCAHRITARRQVVISKWAEKIAQPKHLVTTQRNFPILTRSRIREHQKNLVRLRRSKLFKLVKGGCVSVELTNEDRGWHLHAHWLLDVRWLDIAEVSRAWAHLVGQSDYAIVRIRDCRDRDYLQEVSKYVAKGSEVAGWPPEEIVQFIHAIRGLRFFFSFGSLFKLGRKIRAELHVEKIPTVCDCGCEKFIWRDELHETLHDIRQQARRRR